MKEKSFLDLFLEYHMKSSEGEELKTVLENTIAEERQCVDDYSGIYVPLVPVCNVPPVAQCNVPPQKWLQ